MGFSVVQDGAADSASAVAARAPVSNSPVTYVTSEVAERRMETWVLARAALTHKRWLTLTDDRGLPASVPRMMAALTSLIALVASISAQAQRVGSAESAENEHVKVSVIYTGRTLGALGVLSDPDEHELLTEASNRDGNELQLATYAAWRAPGVSVFRPGADLEPEGFEAFLAAPPEMSAVVQRPALRSNNVTMFQDAVHADVDLLALTKSNPRAAVEFPDLVDASVSIWRGVDGTGRELAVVADDDFVWPMDRAAWTVGEVNRIDVGEDTLFELPVNLGQIGPRATILNRMQNDTAAQGERPILIDLGGRDGDLGLERIDRARLDYSALVALGYTLVVPYELELALGVSGLSALASDYPQVEFLATNVSVAGAEEELFLSERIVQVGAVRIGFFGIVDPELQEVMGRSVLADFQFEAPLDAATRATADLRRSGVDAVVMLSNLHPRENAYVAREVLGIDAIVADLHVRWSPEAVKMSVELPNRPLSRLGSPALVARSFANGLGVGRLELEFRLGEDAEFFLGSLAHELESVTDRTPSDTQLVAQLREMAQLTTRPAGPVLLPDFGELVSVRPALASFDETTALGRISKTMWEKFVARITRYRARAEVGIIRKFPHFPPAIGALRDADIRAWLWTVDTMVVLDLPGADLITLLNDDTDEDLVTSGIDRSRRTIHGRRIEPAAMYRVATTDVIYEGSRARAFARSRRTVRRFETRSNGTVVGSTSGERLPLTTFVLGELERLRNAVQGDAYLQQVAELFDRDPVFESLMTFAFDRPTIFGTFNNIVNNDGFGGVTETRVNSNDSMVYGMSGRFQLTSDLEKYGIDLGVVTAFSRQSGTRSQTNQRFKIETVDDLQLDATLRRKLSTTNRWNPQPFLRTIFDTEYTPTINRSTGSPNPRQGLVRSVGGLQVSPGRWNVVHVGLVFENEAEFDSRELGMEFRADYRRQFGASGSLRYRSSNQLNYFFPASNDDETDLGFVYATVQEVTIPLVDELSLSLAADVFVFRGKIPSMRTYGASAILRIGLTYDRLWKPEYQPFF